MAPGKRANSKIVTQLSNDIHFSEEIVLSDAESSTVKSVATIKIIVDSQRRVKTLQLRFGKKNYIRKARFKGIVVSPWSRLESELGHHLVDINHNENVEDGTFESISEQLKRRGKDCILQMISEHLGTKEDQVSIVSRHDEYGVMTSNDIRSIAEFGSEADATNCLTVNDAGVLFDQTYDPDHIQTKCYARSLQYPYRVLAAQTDEAGSVISAFLTDFCPDLGRGVAPHRFKASADKARDALEVIESDFASATLSEPERWEESGGWTETLQLLCERIREYNAKRQGHTVIGSSSAVDIHSHSTVSRGGPSAGDYKDGNSDDVSLAGVPPISPKVDFAAEIESLIPLQDRLKALIDPTKNQQIGSDELIDTKHGAKNIQAQAHVRNIDTCQQSDKKCIITGGVEPSNLSSPDGSPHTFITNSIDSFLTSFRRTQLDQYLSPQEVHLPLLKELADELLTISKSMKTDNIYFARSSKCPDTIVYGRQIYKDGEIDSLCIRRLAKPCSADEMRDKLDSIVVNAKHQAVPISDPVEHTELMSDERGGVLVSTAGSSMYGGAPVSESAEYRKSLTVLIQTFKKFLRSEPELGRTIKDGVIFERLQMGSENQTSGAPKGDTEMPDRNQ